MPNCSFCGNLYLMGEGKTFVQKSGKILRFCSAKCEKNMLKLNRKARHTKWTKHYVKGE
ncbi:50S ribosomal protein L24e [Candidatus Woesearchaeota archaeon]|nr:50S ribosomal protein L24e [Candidatus Woesearchaeota archaeon]